MFAWAVDDSEAVHCAFGKGMGAKNSDGGFGFLAHRQRDRSLEE
jgi:hypothetical protein